MGELTQKNQNEKIFLKDPAIIGIKYQTMWGANHTNKKRENHYLFFFFLNMDYGSTDENKKKNKNKNKKEKKSNSNSYFYIQNKGIKGQN